MSIVAQNQHHALLIRAQTNLTTPATPTRDIGLIETFNHEEQNNTEPIEASGSRVAVELADGQFTGSIRCTMKYQHGRIFEYVFGGTTVHAVTSADIKHTFAVGDSIKPFTTGHSYNLTADRVRTFAGCKIDELTVEYALGQPIKISWGAEFRTVANTTAALTAVIAAINTLKSHHSSLSYGVDGSETAVGRLESFRVTFKNNLQRYDGAGSRFTTDIEPDTLLIDFEFTKAFDGIAEYEHFLGGTSPATGDNATKSLIFNSHNGVTLGSGRRELNIDLSVTKLVTHGENKQLRGKVMQTFRGMATTINDFYTVDNIASAAWD